MKRKLLSIALGATVLMSAAGCEIHSQIKAVPEQNESRGAEGISVPFASPAAIPKPTAKPSAKIEPRRTIAKTAEKKSTLPQTPEQTTNPKAKPTALPTAAPTIVPQATPNQVSPEESTPNSTIAPTSAPTAKPTTVPEPTPASTKCPKVWVVDVEGHYETVREQVAEEVWEEEKGHYEETTVSIVRDVYRCNHCGYEAYTEDEIDAHGWEEFNKGLAGLYTYLGKGVVGSETETVWIVDEPAHTEIVIREVEHKVWVDEVGHWE